MKRSWVDFAAPPKDPLSPQWQQWYQDYCTTRKSHHDDLFQVDDQGQLKQLYAFNWMETQDWPQMVQWERHLLVWQRWINQTSPGLYAWIGNVVGYQKIWDFGERFVRTLEINSGLPLSPPVQTLGGFAPRDIVDPIGLLAWS